MGDIKRIVVPDGMKKREIEDAVNRLGEEHVAKVYRYLYKRYSETERSIQNNMFTTIKEQKVIEDQEED